MTETQEPYLTSKWQDKTPEEVIFMVRMILGMIQEQVKDIQNTIRVTLERMDGGDK